MGTGLGPTLEFYALVSAEMQRCDLSLWNESDTYRAPSSSIVDAVKAGIEDDATEPMAGSGGTAHGRTNMLIENTTDNTNSAGANQRNQYNSLIDAGALLLNDNDNVTTTNNSTATTNTANDRPYVYAPFGLFPTPIGHGAKVSQLSRVKSKFRFLGKFMAKAIMDSRMVSIWLFFFGLNVEIDE